VPYYYGIGLINDKEEVRAKIAMLGYSALDRRELYVSLLKTLGL
jgi:hypothetical protein